MRFFVTLLILSAIYPQALAQDAIEIIDQKNLQYRGQGLSPWCFAFSEEQLLKDELCTGNSCQENADLWRISIFDIVKDHGQRNSKKFSTQIDKVTSRYFEGSALSFPYISESPSQFRAAQCTLEQPLFYMNRSRAFNPLLLGMHQMLTELYTTLRVSGIPDYNKLVRSYEDLAASPSASAELKQSAKWLVQKSREAKEAMKNPKLAEAFTILEQLAKSSEDANSFILKVLDYSTCESTVTLQKKEVVEKVVSDTAEIATIIARQIPKGSVVVGVCSEVLSKEIEGAVPCGGHAITLKAQRDGEYLVVDSAFFSSRPLNSDGSMWIPKEIVHLAISKMGKHLEATNRNYEDQMAKIQADYEKQISQINSQNNTGDFQKVEESVDQIIEIIKQNSKDIPSDDLKAHVISLFTQIMNSSLTQSQAEPERPQLLDHERMINQILTQAALLDINSLDDIDQIKPTMLGVFKREILANFPKIPSSFPVKDYNLKTGGNIVWLE